MFVWTMRVLAERVTNDKEEIAQQNATNWTVKLGVRDHSRVTDCAVKLKPYHILLTRIL